MGVTETLVIDKDSTGRLWATWVEGGKVWINATVCASGCDDKKWGAPFNLSPSTVSADDISSLIAFDNWIGVMWSNQNTDSFHFAVHANGHPDDVWSIETALEGPNMADDHINLKADSRGRVYAAVRTSRTSDNDPLTMLLVRSAAANWSSNVFRIEKDNHTRPIVQVDEEHGVVHMFATVAETGGPIVTKSSPVDAISFAPGVVRSRSATPTAKFTTPRPRSRACLRPLAW